MQLLIAFVYVVFLYSQFIGLVPQQLQGGKYFHGFFFQCHLSRLARLAFAFVSGLIGISISHRSAQ